MTTAPIPPITGTVSVAVPIEEAFRIFTGSFDAWWPHEYHIATRPPSRFEHRHLGRLDGGQAIHDAI